MAILRDSEALLAAGAKQLGLRLSARQLEQYMFYLNELLRWNKTTNLTGLKDATGIIINLFLDSLTPLPFLDSIKGKKWIDIGTGAGFPGLVLKIAKPEIEMTLLEPNKKKASFLQSLRAQLELDDITVLNDRIEALAPSRKYALLVSRALSPKTVLEKAGQLSCGDRKGLFFQSLQDKFFWTTLLKDYPKVRLEGIYPVKLPFREVPRSIVMLHFNP